MTLHFVRHGQSEWNVLGRVQGQTVHPELTELGRRQAAPAALALAAIATRGPIHRVLSSDLVRAQQTADVIGEALGRPVELEPRLREQALGHLEGLSSTAAFAESVDGWTETTRLGGAASESLRDVADRVGTLLAPWLTAPGKQSAVLVSHGDTIRIALGWLAATAPDRDFGWESLALGNASITTVRLADGQLHYLGSRV